ncbi:hypothetical protein CQW23_18296 [Capsicum baccatum]|uniref:Uncharacterized protein n=1 Tax=Capsicum baccatum TaxID=33114 RepID=A0A2G2WGB0_CAPBA|nr:hypothetical protein CQW23_18296 [Capsicum baccatum]
MHNFIFQGFSKVDVNTSDVSEISQVEQEKQRAIKELENCKQVKRKSILPSSSLDQFLEKQGIHISDDPVEQEEIGEDGWLNSDDDMNVDCGTNGLPQKKNARELTTCKEIHARTLDEREVVTFNLGEAVAKFLIPKEGQKWVMHGLRDAWRGFKREVKRRYFDKRLTVEEMLEKRPTGHSSCSLTSVDRVLEASRS